MGDAAKAEALAQRVEVSGGASAEARGDEIVLRDGEGRLVARYRDGVGLVIESEGDLTLAAPAGAVKIDADTILLEARRLQTRAEDVLHFAGRFEVRAERVIERARDAYRTCEGLMQHRAGRARQLVEGAYDLLAGRTSIASDEETKIDGKKVLLG